MMDAHVPFGCLLLLCRFTIPAGEPGSFRHFWITNTFPTTAIKLAGVAPFEVLSIAPVVLSALQ